jgi:hypothetical protein
MTTIVNYECEAAIAALVIAGIDSQEATQKVSALYRVLPEATAEDLTQIVLTSTTLSELRTAGLQFRVPEEFKSVVPQLAPLLEYLRQTPKLKSWFGRR